ncbi:MAG TPA: hypothetical protein PK784_04505 [Tenuifilaceae bacterium]|nr:hypothetical protein [Tenuifilaceae bacterium]
MTNVQIQALGNLLQYYRSDLTYIREFKRYKLGKTETGYYLSLSYGTFKSFINEYRVARNVEKSKTDFLLQLTMQWVNTKGQKNVDVFAKLLKEKGITHGKVMTSLASKILFLNDPWTILPLDNLAKQAVGLKTNIYSHYIPKVDEFKQKNKREIDSCLNSVSHHLKIIEVDFKDEVENIEMIRYNRFVDKLLWTIGRYE